MQHTGGEAYSARNPVPNISKHKEEMAHHQKEIDEDAARQQKENDEADAAADDPGPEVQDKENLPPDKQHLAKGKSGAEEKAEMMEKMQKPKEPPNKRLQLKGERTVRDPVTDSDVRIHDAAMKKWDDLDLDNVDPKKQTSKSASLSPVEDASTIEPSRISPDPARPSNICLQSFPPPVEASSMLQVRKVLTKNGYYFAAGLVIVWFFTAFGQGWKTFVWRSTVIGAVAIVAAVQVGVTANQMEKEIERVRFEMHRQRAEKHSPPTPESVEWLNAFISTFMGLLDPAFFYPIADQIEDVMQASLPGFIDAVKVADIGQGTNPFRILAMRALPDQPGDKGYPKEEWIDQGKQDSLSPEEKKKQEEDAKDGKSEGFDDQAGDYVNFEVSFAYQAKPGQSDKLKAHNIHMMLEFFIGVYDWFHIPLPIWIQVEGIVGTVRLRIQMIPESPYVRNLTFTMMGVPKIEVSAKPMIQKLPNILDLPLISGFVQSSISAAMSEYVAPKSMSMNIQEMMSGAALTESTHAIGVIAVTIHHATNLSSQDSNGYSDPYIVLAYAKFGKPLYSTRIIMEDLNPVFEETAFLLVSDDEVKAKEDLSIMLWDSDERSSDDLVGRVQLPISEMMAKPNQIARRTDKLKGYEDADEMSGELTWSVGFFAKAVLEPARQKDELTKAKHESAPAGQPAGPKTPAKAMVVSPTNTPPSPDRPSGILSIILHHINNLERANLVGASGGDREGAAGQDVADPSDQDANLPSSYAEFIVDDQLVYKTRVKQYTTQPFFNAGTEVFVRNWKDTVVRLAVRDSRLREKDPLLGVVSIDLEKLFTDAKASQVTQLFSLQEGVGFGRAQVSILFQAIEAKLPKNLLGWDTATIEIDSPITLETSDDVAHELGSKKLSVKTSEDTIKVSPRGATIEGGKITWQVSDEGPLRLPVFERYKSAVVFQIGSAPDVFAALWLSTLVDEEKKEVRIPLIRGKRLKRLRQHFINDQLQKTHEYSVCGYLRCRVHVDPGLDPDHAKYATSAVKRHTFEAYDNTEGQAEQAERNSHANDDGVIDASEKKAIKRAHTKALHSRHRGAMQFAPVRTSVWMKEGMAKRAKTLKNKITGHVEQQEEVPTEGRA